MAVDETSGVTGVTGDASGLGTGNSGGSGAGEGSSGAGVGGSRGFEQPGDFVGPYKLMSVLGEGGFGTVWLAERREPMVQRVALKIIKPGMDSKSVIARFEQERQALAVMDHPNVARVFDGGVTELSQRGGGRPYFVMEYVQGEPITAFCDRHTYTIRQRLELFIPVCEAVQHAHMKGIIHRDIKPSNVLVSIKDDAAVVKVIDFGIAKAVKESGWNPVDATQTGMVIGTPEYMSPEQVSGETDVDTRTDVYSLGVVLYELLIGELPFDWRELRRRGYAEIQRIIREETPARPSTRVRHSGSSDRSGGDSESASSGRGGTDPGRKRRTTSASLARELARELEWIPLMALRKERDRRYASPSELAADVKRYLTGEPLRAGPESGLYRARKFVRRHRASVIGVGAVMFALAGGAGVASWQARAAEVQRKLAESSATRASEAEAAAEARASELERVATFQEEMLTQIDPALAGRALSERVMRELDESLRKAGADEAERAAQAAAFGAFWARINATDTALDVIDRAILTPGAEAIGTRFADQPVVEATLRQAIAERYRQFGMYERALPLQQAALEIRARELGERHADYLMSLHLSAFLASSRGELDESSRLGEESLAKTRSALGEDDRLTLTAISTLGSIRESQGRWDEAESLHREALEGRRRVFGAEDEATLVSLNNLGLLLMDMGKLEEAEPLLRECLEIRRRTLGDDHPATNTSINNLGLLHHHAGEFEEAEKYYREGLERSRRTMGEAHPDTLISINNIGTLMFEMGRNDDAIAALAELVEVSTRVLGERHADTLRAEHNLGYAYRTAKRLDEAETLVARSLEGRRAVLGPDHPETLASVNVLAIIRRDQGRAAEAEAGFREALEGRRRVLGSEHAITLSTVENLAILLREQEREADVATVLSADEASARSVFTESSPVRLATWLSSLGRARVGMGYEAGGFPSAEANLLEAHSLFVAARGETHAQTTGCARVLVTLYEAWDAAEPEGGYAAKAAEWRERAAAEEQ